MSLLSADKAQQRVAELALLLVTVIWGSTFIITRTTVATANPFVLLALRFSIAVVVLAVPFFPKMLRATRRDIGAGILLGVIFFVGNALQTSGLQYTSAGTSGFITAMSVVIVPVLAVPILHQRPSLGTTAGIVLATVGLALLSLSDNLSLSYGDLLTLGCALAFAFHIIFIGKYAAKTEPVVIMAVQFALAAAASAVMAGPAELLQPLTSELALAGLYLGLMATALAFTLQVYAQRRTSANRTALIFTMEPVFAALFAYLVAGEMLTERGLVGCGLIFLGMIAAELM